MTWAILAELYLGPTIKLQVQNDDVNMNHEQAGTW